MTVPKVRVRARKPKTKTGCKTCRARRIKCDEEKPCCRRCASTGRTCDGYGAAAISSREFAHRTTTISVQSASVTPMTLRMTSALGLSDEDFWESLVLQISDREPSVLHAAIAVGCAHRKQAERNLFTQATDVEDQRQFFGLKQYLKAISSLRNRIKDLEDPQSSQIALITCLLFICHEMLRGQRVGAICHLATGLRILSSRINSDSINESDTLVLQHNSENIQDHLMSTFARLDYDSTMFGQRSPRFFLYPSLNSAIRDLSVPSNFSSLLEARQYVDILASGVLRFRGELLKLASLTIPNASPDFLTQALWEHATARLVDLSDNPTLLSEQRRLQDGLAVWSAAFKYFKDRLNPSQKEDNSAALALLEIKHFYPYFLLSTCQITKEKYCDSFNQSFKRIVSLAGSYIDRTSTSAQPLFTLDSGVLPSLYLTAMKCRQQETRRQAISLLRKSTCQEGMWEGSLIAEFVERIADLEEARALGMDEYEKIVDIDEVGRFCDVVLATTDDPTRGKLICARYCHEAGGGLTVWDEYFSLKE